MVKRHFLPLALASISGLVFAGFLPACAIDSDSFENWPSPVPISKPKPAQQSNRFGVGSIGAGSGSSVVFSHQSNQAPKKKHGKSNASSMPMSGVLVPPPPPTLPSLTSMLAVPPPPVMLPYSYQGVLGASSVSGYAQPQADSYAAGSRGDSSHRSVYTDSATDSS